MITEEEMEAAVYARFSGSDVQNSACRGAWRYGANWAIDRMRLELDLMEAFRRASDKGFVETVSENTKLKEAIYAAKKNIEDGFFDDAWQVIAELNL